VTSLKAQHRGNLISFGCGELAYELAKQGLADEIHFWVNPAVSGSGRPGLPRPPGPDARDRDDRVRLGRRPSLLRATTECAGERNDLTSPGLSVRG
jgi:dihydrofolate reductase